MNIIVITRQQSPEFLSPPSKNGIETFHLDFYTNSVVIVINNDKLEQDQYLLIANLPFFWIFQVKLAC